jgi:hypothetical protein
VADRRQPSSRPDDPTTSPPEAVVGITNQDLASENANERRVKQRQQAQERGDAPIGTHEGITLDERDAGVVRGVDPGFEAERGADRGSDADR